MSKKQRIVVGMSGGVDSSVTAWLLKQQGHEVIGVFMQNWEDDNDNEYCSIKQDSLDALSVADIIGIDMEIINFSAEYKDRVFAHFLSEYSAGRTPNPDVLCNAEIKFKAFLDYALSIGADCIATGHYARKSIINGQHHLLKAIDKNKDQSYFLYRLNQYQLRHAIFPLGDIQKTEVRQLAAQAGLPNAMKKDSTGICFIGERPFRQFLQRYLPTSPGEMLTPEGEIVGQHQGLMYYTIGQRKGLNIGGKGEAWFVYAKNMEKNQLIVVQGHNHPLLLRKNLQISNLSWTQDKAPEAGKYACKIRYRTADAIANLSFINSEQALVEFDLTQWAIASGQSTVIYHNDVCLGGGVIL